MILTLVVSCGSDNKIVVCDTSAVHESAWHDLSPPRSSHFVSLQDSSAKMDVDDEPGGSVVHSVSIAPRVATRYSQGVFHSDYVKKVKAMEGSSGNELIVYSIGLDSQLRQSSLRPGGGSLQAVTSWDAKSSLYSLAVRKVDDSWSLIATGGSDGLVKVFDSRIEKKPIMKLRSHSEVVKTLYLPENPSSTNIVSGSADGSIKVWDLRNAKVQNTLAIHEDSVWNIAGPPPSNSDTSTSLKFYSGGRDGSVYLTDVEASQTRLLFKEPHPILCLAPMTDTLWVSTTDAVITRWEVGDVKGEATTQGTQIENFSRNSINLASSPISSPVHTMGMQSSVEQVLDSGEPIMPSLSAEKAMSKTPKRNSLVSYCVLPDKIRVVTKDNTGRVQVWNVLDLVVESDLGVLNEEIDFIAERLSTKKQFLPKWFTADVRSGQLTINVEPYPRCTEAAFTPPEAIIACERDADRPYSVAVAITFQKIFRAFLEDEGEQEVAKNEDSSAPVHNGASQDPHAVKIEKDLTATQSDPSAPSTSSMEAGPSKTLSPPAPNFLDVIVTLSKDSGHQQRIRSSEIRTSNFLLPQWVVKVMSEPASRPKKPSTTLAFTFRPKRKGIFRTDRPDITYNMHRAFTVAGMAEYIRDRCASTTGVTVPRSQIKVTLEDVELPIIMDIGSVKHFLWKESSPIPLFYDYDIDKVREAM